MRQVGKNRATPSLISSRLPTASVRSMLRTQHSMYAIHMHVCVHTYITSIYVQTDRQTDRQTAAGGRAGGQTDGHVSCLRKGPCGAFPSPGSRHPLRRPPRFWPQISTAPQISYLGLLRLRGAARVEENRDVQRLAIDLRTTSIQAFAAFYH